MSKTLILCGIDYYLTLSNITMLSTMWIEFFVGTVKIMNYLILLLRTAGNWFFKKYKLQERISQATLHIVWK